MTYGPITSKDAVVVHRHLLWHDAGRWLAIGDEDQTLLAADADDMLRQIADAVGSDDDIETLRGKLRQAIESSARQLSEDELYRTRTQRGGGRHG